MSIALIVATQTTIIESSRGFAFCATSIPVSVNPKGLSIGGTKGAKNMTHHKIHSCAIIIFFLDKVCDYIILLNVPNLLFLNDLIDQ